MITLHHLDNSRSHRVLWMLEELGIPYEVRLYKRDPDTMFAPAELRAIHPLGKSPVITDGNLTLAESGAILDYLARTYQGKTKLRPDQETDTAGLRYSYWLHYAEGSLMLPLVTSLVFSQIPKQPLPFFIKPIVKEIVAKVHAGYLNKQFKLHRDFIETELGKSPYFAGSEFSAADIQMSFPLQALMTRSKLKDTSPRIQKFLADCEARPAYQRATEKGGGVEIFS